MASSEIMEALQKCEIFSNINEEDIQQIAQLCSIESYEAGDTVFAQGEYGTKIYLIAEGQVALVRSVSLGGRQGTMTVDILGKGRGLGWSSFLCDPCSVSASAVCQKPSQLVSLSGADLRAMLEGNTDLGFKVMDRLAQIVGNRLRAAYGAMDTFR
ncbi:MAG: cyclic nucleotide-binding domain-containing protein [Chloroflexi bacterium]|jgi:CRP/FNR family transcriptional regulator, cyclic AMP receptor protein|nr:cyclic nucleotide-binding domain-containing protein [Chloroflexota bacterium]